MCCLSLVVVVIIMAAWLGDGRPRRAKRGSVQEAFQWNNSSRRQGFRERDEKGGDSYYILFSINLTF
jgi:hypothetical protein